MRVYGPVPSRRLGRSLGVNNIPAKVCSYSCVYCQLGSVSGTYAGRKGFYPPQELIAEVKEKITGEVDYVSFVPDGEPTLDLNLGEEIKGIKEFGVKVAVITNSSLLYRADVRGDLMEADWVSLKIDSVREATWKRINRPEPSLELKEMMEGMCKFAKEYSGFLATETMLLQGLNDTEEEIAAAADFISKLGPDVAYISIPTRPPAEEVMPASEEKLNEAYQIFKDRGLKAELLTGYEGDEFSSTGDVREDLLSITSVHPMREDAVRKMLREKGRGWDLAEEMLSARELIELEYLGEKYYMRRLFRTQ